MLQYIELVFILLLILIVVIANLRSLKKMENEYVSGAAENRDKDLRRYLISNARVDIINGVPKANHAELIKILERWTISMIVAGRDPWNITAADTHNPETMKMISEMVEKRMDRINAITLTERLLHVEPTVSKRIVPTYPADRINKLHARLPVDMNSKDADLEIANAVLRYRALLSGSQQWAVPAHVYDHFAEKFEINLEGFSSPFNSQIPAPGKYCSIFPEDAVFGSVGDFFQLNLDGYRAIINPPFVESLIHKVVMKLEPLLKRGMAQVSLYCVVVPAWRDAEFYKHLNRLMTLPGVVAKRIILEPADKYFYEDTSSPEVRKIPARFESAWFCFGLDAKKITKADLL